MDQTVLPWRQRMIDDMRIREMGQDSYRPYPRCVQVRRAPEAFTGYRDRRRAQTPPAAHGRHRHVGRTISINSGCIYELGAPPSLDGVRHNAAALQSMAPALRLLTCFSMRSRTSFGSTVTSGEACLNCWARLVELKAVRQARSRRMSSDSRHRSRGCSPKDMSRWCGPTLTAQCAEKACGHCTPALPERRCATQRSTSCWHCLTHCARVAHVSVVGVYAKAHRPSTVDACCRKTQECTSHLTETPAVELSSGVSSAAAIAGFCSRLRAADEETRAAFAATGVDPADNFGWLSEAPMFHPRARSSSVRGSPPGAVATWQSSAATRDRPERSHPW